VVAQLDLDSAGLLRIANQSLPAEARDRREIREHSEVWQNEVRRGEFRPTRELRPVQKISARSTGGKGNSTKEISEWNLQNLHARLAHFKGAKIKATIRSEGLGSIRQPLDCTSCSSGNASRRPRRVSNSVINIRSFLWTDLSGKKETSARSYKYFQVLLRMPERYIVVRLLQDKSSVSASVIDEINRMERSFPDKPIQSVKGDNELRTMILHNFCRQRGIRLETIASNNAASDGPARQNHL
jgi:hypothetical protein